MPPTIITSARPSTTKPISPAWRKVSPSASGDQKLPITRPEISTTSTSSSTGIAVSVQRFARISPSQWSGQ